MRRGSKCCKRIIPKPRLSQRRFVPRLALFLARLGTSDKLRPCMLAKEQQRTLWVAVVLILGTALLYWPVAGFDFINLDDNEYILTNLHVRNGFSWAALPWCFQAGYANNWHPLTWLSHMLDCQFFGLRPGPPHVVNVLLHTTDSVMLFVVFRRLTGAFWRSAMVSALFAWHPLHVESVAWVAERKDVLSAFFWILTLWAYIRYVEESKIQNPKHKLFYALALLFFALGLMAKPMVVTLPFILLLLDWWPLKRLAVDDRRACSRLILEKVPFGILAAGSCAMTLIAQNRGGAVATLEFVSLGTRASNSIVSYLRYAEKLFWPSNLSAIYPLASKLPPLEILLALGFLVGVTVVAIVLRGSRPWLLVGWLWFLGTLIPVIGIVQVGGQSMADRYSYIPSIGIFIIVCWMANDFARDRPLILTALAVAALAGCAIQTSAQVKYWRNSGTLFRHALAIDPNNYIAHGCYGCYLRDTGQLEPACAEFRRAIEISPIYMAGYTFLSEVLETEGKKEDAMKVLRDGLKIRPDFSGARCEVSKILLTSNRLPEAESELKQGLELDPADGELHLYLGYALAQQHKFDAAEKQLSEGVRLVPDDPAGHFQWALVLSAQHDTAAAISQYRAALNIQPDLPNALNNLAWLLASSPDPHDRDPVEALKLSSRACALTQTNDAIKIQTLANACASAGRFDEAVEWAQRASQVALAHGQTNVAEQNLKLEKLFKAHRAYYEFQ
jgi:tetratricopeptide (TPR) repeat protein